MAFGTFYETLGTILINNIVQNCTEGFSSPNNALSDYNISDLALDAPGANSKNSATVIFVNAASENFHLSSSDTTARGAGTDPCRFMGYRSRSISNRELQVEVYSGRSWINNGH
jgi:hypothetical protein